MSDVKAGGGSFMWAAANDVYDGLILTLCDEFIGKF